MSIVGAGLQLDVGVSENNSYIEVVFGRPSERSMDVSARK